MSFKVVGQTIYITRGDSGYAEVTMKNKDKTPYVPQEGDAIRFALKTARMKPGNTDFADQKPLVIKPIPNTTMLLEFFPNDTKKLSFGTYKYDIEITKADGYVDTFIENADFIITPEVY